MLKNIMLTISGKKWLIKFDNKSNGGCFDTDRRELVIGTKSEYEQEENAIHEILEAILVEHNCRYSLEVKQPDNGDYLFAFNHKEYMNIARDLAYSLKELATEMRKQKEDR